MIRLRSCHEGGALNVQRAGGGSHIKFFVDPIQHSVGFALQRIKRYGSTVEVRAGTVVLMGKVVDNVAYDACPSSKEATVNRFFSFMHNDVQKGDTT